MRRLLLIVSVFAALASHAFSGPLHDAVKDGDIAKVAQLIASGEDINQNHKTLGTPLHHAGIWGSREIADLLISAGADVNARHPKLGTPLHRAARKGNAAVAAVMIGHGADVNAHREFQLTPLHDAAEGGDAGIVDLLVANGAGIDARSIDNSLKPGILGWAGYPPVHAAGSNDHINIVDLLRAYGSRPPNLEPLSKFIASASASEGESLFTDLCAACHTIEKGGLANRGANLWGIIGKKKAGIEGFAYSSAFGRLAGKWTPAELNAFIAAPTTYVPGTKMRIEDLPDAAARASLIAYLQLKSDNPPPQP